MVLLIGCLVSGGSVVLLIGCLVGPRVSYFTLQSARPLNSQGPSGQLGCLVSPRISYFTTHLAILMPSLESGGLVVLLID